MLLNQINPLNNIIHKLILNVRFDLILIDKAI